MKAVVFDCDRSLATLGNKDEIKDIFGFNPVPIMGGVDQISDYLAVLLKKEDVSVADKDDPLAQILGTTSKLEEQFVPNEKAREMGIEGIIVDSVSVLADQTREKLMTIHKVDSMNQHLWAVYGAKMMTMLRRMAHMQAVIVCTSHIKSKQDEFGGPIDLPAIQGSASTDAARFFDIIMYAKVKRKKSEGSIFSWITKPDDRHPIAKDRKDILPPVMDQNLGEVIGIYRKAGIMFPKILIMGHSGQGKTTSLGTINAYEQ